MGRLDPGELGRRLDDILAAAERMIRVVPEPALDEALRDQAFRIFRLGLAFADGMDLGRFPGDWRQEPAPADLRDGAAVARYGALVRGRLAGWFEGAGAREFARTIAVDDGPQPGLDLLERVAAAAAEALRALHATLARRGLGSREPLPAAVHGLPTRPW
ncbi:MAG TPA: hypothetical protein VLK35_14315 [Methylomirabilota bacterium]|nr:hypothetical protein [Methylomirabilota bacterium]